MHHSDRGVQYASRDYAPSLPAHGIAITMSRKGNPYDNAVAESFMKTLKYGNMVESIATTTRICLKLARRSRDSSNKSTMKSGCIRP